ncbi:MAG: hypothetical protein AAF628_27305 [Planctomycetota bacterium]
MTDHTARRAELQAFGRHYQYDVGYLEHLHEAAPAAFDTFAAAQGMGTHREALPVDAHFVARITAMQADDCGPCGQLNVRMALEAGVDRELLRTLLEAPDHLPPALADVAAHTRATVTAGRPDPERARRLAATYGEQGLAELAVCIAGSRIYPTLKRALLRADTCARLSVDV